MRISRSPPHSRTLRLCRPTLPYHPRSSHILPAQWIRAREAMPDDDAAHERLLLSDNAVAVLRVRIAGAVQRGEELEVATRHALAQWHRQHGRRQVQQ